MKENSESLDDSDTTKRFRAGDELVAAGAISATCNAVVYPIDHRGPGDYPTRDLPWESSPQYRKPSLSFRQQLRHQRHKTTARHPSGPFDYTMNQEPETLSTARPLNQPRETPASMEEESESPTAPAPTDRASHPTHELEDLRIGDNGVQMLVSNHGHLYKAKGIEGGRDSWQCVGTWSDETIQGFARLIAERHSTSSNQHTANDQASGNKDGYGPGRTLGLSAKSARVPDA